MLVCYAFPNTDCGGDGAFEMRQIEFSRYEQQLSQRATEALKRMTELKKLRELVRLAEAAKGLPEGLTRSPLSSIRLPDFNCLTSQRGRLPRPAQVSEG